MSTKPQFIWHDPDWQKQAHDWILSEAERSSIQLTGDIEQPHVLPQHMEALRAGTTSRL